MGHRLVELETKSTLEQREALLRGVMCGLQGSSVEERLIHC